LQATLYNNLCPFYLIYDCKKMTLNNLLAGNATGTKVTQKPSGAYLAPAKTVVLNKGWELVAVTGASGADHALYLKRAKLKVSSE
jgi:hypothetical protein